MATDVQIMYVTTPRTRTYDAPATQIQCQVQILLEVHQFYA